LNPQIAAVHESAIVKIFGCRPLTNMPHARAAGVGKSPREETAGNGVWRFVARYGDLNAADDAAGGRLSAATA
jgi:hypothetical protein